VVEFQHEGDNYSHLHYSNHFLIILKAFKIDSLIFNVVLCFTCILWVTKPCCFKGFVLQKIRSKRNWPPQHNVQDLKVKINKYGIYIQDMDRIMENTRHC